MAALKVVYRPLPQTTPTYPLLAATKTNARRMVIYYRGKDRLLLNAIYSSAM